MNVRASALLGLVALGTAAAAGLVRLRPDADPRGLPVDAESLRKVDLQVVHEELVPDWVVASGGMKRLHFDHLERVVAPDPALGALLARLRVLLESDPVGNAPELLGVVRAWNEVLAKGGQPWRLAGEIRVGEGGGELLLKTYKVVYDGGRVRVGDRTFPAEVRRRVDRTSLVDGWLGHMHDPQDGAVVLLDRVAAFAQDQVWPLLDPGLDRRQGPTAAAFAPAVRAEVAAALTPEELGALTATAADRYWLNVAAGAITDRRRCGSQFYVARVPWNGFAPEDLATLRTHASRTPSSCPEVTQTEALLLGLRSADVRDTPGVRDALDHLTGVVAHAVVVHEARHAYDDQVLEGQRIQCVGCPSDTSPVGALEGAAYLASFADPQTGALSMYQACSLDPDQIPDRSSMITWLSQRLSGGCASAPPAELVSRARALATETFGDAAPIEVLDFPSSLPVGLERL